MSNDDVSVRKDGQVGIMAIDRPNNLNAFTPGVLEGLRDAMESFDEDDEGLMMSTEESLDTVHRAQRVQKALHRTPLPVVGSINGYAMGAGMDFALGCDIRVVRADTKLGLSYVNVMLPRGTAGRTSFHGSSERKLRRS